MYKIELNKKDLEFLVKLLNDEEIRLIHDGVHNKKSTLACEERRNLNKCRVEKLFNRLRFCSPEKKEEPKDESINDVGFVEEVWRVHAERMYKELEETKNKIRKLNNLSSLKSVLNEMKKYRDNLEFKSYKNTQETDIRPYSRGETFCMWIDGQPNTSVSKELTESGHPKLGDMVCRDPNNHDDQWLITEQYFNYNYAKIDATKGVAESLSNYQAHFMPSAPKETPHRFDSYLYNGNVVCATEHKIGDTQPDEFKNFFLSEEMGDKHGKVMLIQRLGYEGSKPGLWVERTKRFKRKAKKF